MHGNYSPLLSGPWILILPMLAVFLHSITFISPCSHYPNAEKQRADPAVSKDCGPNPAAIYSHNLGL